MHTPHHQDRLNQKNTTRDPSQEAKPRVVERADEGVTKHAVASPQTRAQRFRNHRLSPSKLHRPEHVPPGSYPITQSPRVLRRKRGRQKGPACGRRKISA